MHTFPMEVKMDNPFGPFPIFFAVVLPGTGADLNISFSISWKFPPQPRSPSQEPELDTLQSVQQAHGVPSPEYCSKRIGPEIKPISHSILLYRISSVTVIDGGAD